MDYYPFGMQMGDRTYPSGDNYRFGYNGMMGDKEWSSQGNSYMTEFRMYDPRLGRWLSCDPMIQSWESPYSGMGNNPIFFNDPQGLWIKSNSKQAKKDFKKYHKEIGDWKKIKKDYKGIGKNKRNLQIRASSKSRETLATGSIESYPSDVTEKDQGGKHAQKTDWFVFNPGGDHDVFDQTAGDSPNPIDINIDPIDPIPTRIKDIPNPIDEPLIKLRPIQHPPHIRFREVHIYAPFIGGDTRFADPIAGMNQLQRIANTYLNSLDANEIIITIGTSTVNLNLPSRAPFVGTVRQLLWARARAMRNILIGMGVPASAFLPTRWLIFAPGETIGTNISVR